MQYGFLGYCFGIGLGLVLFTTWLRLRDRSPAARVAFLLASGTLLMLCHLAAFGLFAIAVGMFELMDDRRFTRLLAPVLSLTAIFLVFTILSPTAGTAHAYQVHFSDLHDKLRAFAAITFFSSMKLEGLLLAAALLGLALAMITRTVRWDRRGLAMIGVMVLVWLVTPNYALDVDYIDYRLPWGISFFALASLLPGQRRFAGSFAGWFGFLSVARIAIIAVLWLRWEPTINRIDEALAQVPEGARVMTVVGEPSPTSGFRDPDLSNVGSYAVIRRHGFEPGIFASIPGQILQLQPHYRELAAADGLPETPLSELTRLEPDYDYVLVLSPELAKVAPRVAEVLVPESEGPHFKLFRVARLESGTAAGESHSKSQ